jgi:hypothetical protein
VYIKNGVLKNHRGLITQEMKKKIIAIDFDGTLSYGDYPACGPRNENLINLLKKLLSYPLEDRNYYILWTSRTKEPLAAAIAWLKVEGIVFDAVNDIPEALKETTSYTRKIHALYYVDDRALNPDDFIKMWDGVCDTD